MMCGCLSIMYLVGGILASEVTLMSLAEMKAVVTGDSMYLSASCAFSVSADSGLSCSDRCHGVCRVSDESMGDGWSMIYENYTYCLDDKLSFACSVPLGLKRRISFSSVGTSTSVAHYMAHSSRVIRPWYSKPLRVTAGAYRSGDILLGSLGDYPSINDTNLGVFGFANPVGPTQDVSERPEMFDDEIGFGIQRDPKDLLERYRVNQHTLTMEHELILDGVFREFVDPYRLIYAAVSRRDFIRAGDNATVHVMAGTRDASPSEVYNGTGSYANLNYTLDSQQATYQIGKVKLNYYSDNGVNRLDLFPNRDVDFKIPPITPYIQQWFLSREEQWPLREENNKIRLLLDVRDQDSSVIDRLTASRFELETFTGFGWNFLVSDLCAAHTTCAMCTRSALCHWCDMSEAGIDEWTEWATWREKSRSSSGDGSACGVPPMVCVLLGGESFASKCKPSLNKHYWRPS